MEIIKDLKLEDLKIGMIIENSNDRIGIITTDTINGNSYIVYKDGGDLITDDDNLDDYIDRIYIPLDDYPHETIQNATKILNGEMFFNNEDSGFKLIYQRGITKYTLTKYSFNIFADSCLIESYTAYVDDNKIYEFEDRLHEKYKKIYREYNLNHYTDIKINYEPMFDKNLNVIKKELP